MTMIFDSPISLILSRHIKTPLFFSLFYLFSAFVLINTIGAAEPVIEWSSQIQTALETPPAVGPDGTLYIATRKTTGLIELPDLPPRLYAISPSDGSEKWHFDFSLDGIPFKVVLSFGSLRKNLSSRDVGCMLRTLALWRRFFRASRMFAKG